MKRRGILNADLNRYISRLGHGQFVVVADCGMPIPRNAPLVDLAVVVGVPSFTEVLDALLEDVIFEASTCALESKETIVERWIVTRGLTPEFVSHEQLKDMVAGAALIVRTGEATPYANVILRCGVDF